MEMEDDGVGLPERFDPMTAGGMGFVLIRSLAASLGAKVVRFDSLGSCFRFTFSGAQ